MYLNERPKIDNGTLKEGAAVYVQREADYYTRQPDTYTPGKITRIGKNSYWVLEKGATSETRFTTGGEAWGTCQNRRRVLCVLKTEELTDLLRRERKARKEQVDAARAALIAKAEKCRNLRLLQRALRELA